MTGVTAAIPVKPFDQAKRRLSAVLGPEARRNVGQQLAHHTIDTVMAANVDVLVLSADDGVTEWARAEGIPVLLDEGSSLNRAAELASLEILGGGGSFMVVHADLPLLDVVDVANAASLLAKGSSVLAPSSDGGTSMIGSRSAMRFAYGPGSFRRHLAALSQAAPAILVSRGWALDLDTPQDLDALRRLPTGAWLTGI